MIPKNNLPRLPEAFRPPGARPVPAPGSAAAPLPGARAAATHAPHNTPPQPAALAPPLRPPMPPQPRRPPAAIQTVQPKRAAPPPARPLLPVLQARLAPAAPHHAALTARPATPPLPAPPRASAPGRRAVLQRAERADSDDEGSGDEESSVNNSGYDADIDGWYDYGSRAANQGAKVFRLAKHKGPDQGTKLQQLFLGSAQIQGKRSYARQRYVQVLRWLATLLLNRYKGVEIQCYLHKGKVYISSNKNAVNTTMQEALKKGTLLPGKSPHSGGSRLARHSGKLYRDAGGHSKEEAELKALIFAKDGLVIVPADDKLDCDLHAERRIKRYLQQELDPLLLGGTRRACGVCAVALDLPKHSHTGPIWTTSAGLGGLSETTVRATAEQKGYYSHLTLRRDTGKLSFDVNTDSDSDV